MIAAGSGGVFTRIGTTATPRSPPRRAPTPPGRSGSVSPTARSCTTGARSRCRTSPAVRGLSTRWPPSRTCAAWFPRRSRRAGQPPAAARAPTQYEPRRWPLGRMRCSRVATRMRPRATPSRVRSTQAQRRGRWRPARHGWSRTPAPMRRSLRRPEWCASGRTEGSSRPSSRHRTVPVPLAERSRRSMTRSATARRTTRTTGGPECSTPTIWRRGMTSARSRGPRWSRRSRR